MGIITNMYKKNFLVRYDKDEAIPYFSLEDFPGLNSNEDSFINSENISIKYFIYYYDGYKEDKLIIFCPGMGPGHTAYLSEIETICKRGYKVLTLDYTGCALSGGDYMTSTNAPTRDIMELLNVLNPKEELIPVGHSLGGYTALNLININENINKAVIISGFISIDNEMMTFMKPRLISKIIKRYEKKLIPLYGNLNNLDYLKSTNDKILWFHSIDDPMVSYKYNAQKVKDLNNPNIKLITLENKKHNPEYTKEALDNMNKWLGEYYRKIREKELNTLEEKRAYFSDKPIGQMTKQDKDIYDEIVSFIENGGD